jgi:hypothetical protein
VIGEQRIGGRVALVEAIAGELVDQVEQFVGLVRLDVRNFLAARHEAQALVHFRLDLLAHRAAQQVGIAQRIARQDLRGLHHLFLIDEDAVGFGQMPKLSCGYSMLPARSCDARTRGCCPSGRVGRARRAR